MAEIAKVVEEGMVVLRLEMCQREAEIKKLRSNVEVLHTELRAAQERGTLRPGGETHRPEHMFLMSLQTGLNRIKIISMWFTTAPDLLL